MLTRQLTIAIWFAVSADARAALTIALSLSLSLVFIVAANAKGVEKKGLQRKAVELNSTAQKPLLPISRIINFPKDYSLGTVHIIPYNPTHLGAWPHEAVSRHKAQGALPIRGDGVALLMGSYQLAENMSALKTLKPNDLQILDMYRCEIEDKDIENITGLTGLIGLQLDDTEIGDSSLKPISKLPNLNFLTLSSTQISGANLSQLSSLKKLKRLELGHNLIKKENLKELIKLPQIEKLGLQGCKISDSDLETIAKLDNLTVLMLLENDQITDLGLKKLVSMKKLFLLEITHARITPNGLKALTKLPLSKLVLGKRQFTPSQFERIKKMFPHTEIAAYDNSERMDPELFKPLH
ncbi:hypothetical protein BH11CYA1_BH11CYA1_26950 [soil metagenome]